MIGFIGYCQLLARDQQDTLTVEEMLAIIRDLDAQIAAVQSSDGSVTLRVPLQPRLES